MSEITESAIGEQCLVRLPNVCSFDAEKTVFAHRNGAGMALKHKDLFGAYCCSSCHAIVDGGKCDHLTREEILIYFWEGVFRTQQALLEKGLIIIK